LVMNVHPSAVVNLPGPTTAEPFAPEALYEFRIDTNGDVVADIAYRVRLAICFPSFPMWALPTKLPDESTEENGLTKIKRMMRDTKSGNPERSSNKDQGNKGSLSVRQPIGESHSTTRRSTFSVRKPFRS